MTDETAAALAAIGLTAADFEREDFNRRAGRRAAKVLRQRGYELTRIPTHAGKAVIRWCPAGVSLDPCANDMPAFNVLVASFVRR
jgi:hypothetical protein